jgi:predicted RNA-binding Zn-ribbon protein involved in translation (DUF1610 family)
VLSWPGIECGQEVVPRCKIYRFLGTLYLIVGLRLKKVCKVCGTGLPGLVRLQGHVLKLNMRIPHIFNLRGRAHQCSSA